MVGGQGLLLTVFLALMVLTAWSLDGASTSRSTMVEEDGEEEGLGEDEDDCDVRLKPLETFRFQWSIHNFSCRPEEQDSVILSPLFPMDPLAQTKWQVAIYPHGRARFMGDVPAFYICLIYHEGSNYETATYKLSILHKDFESNGIVYSRKGGEGLRFTTSKCFGRILDFSREELLKEYVQDDDVVTVAYTVRRYREVNECPSPPECPVEAPGPPRLPPPPPDGLERPLVRCHTSYQEMDPVLRYVWEVKYWEERLTIPLLESTASDTEWETEVRLVRERLSPEQYLSVHLCLKKTPRPYEMALFNVSVAFKEDGDLPPQKQQPWTFAIDTVTYFLNPGPNPQQLYCWGRVATPFHTIFRDKRYKQDKELVIVVHIRRVQEFVSCQTDPPDSYDCPSVDSDTALGENKEMQILAALWASQQTPGESEWRQKLVSDLQQARNADPVALTSDIFSLAHKYGMTELKAACENLLMQQLRVDNALEFLQLANTLEASQLKDEAVELAVANFKDISTTKEWRRLNKKQPALAALIKDRIAPQ